MTVQDTSIEAYNTIKANGLLGARQMQVLGFIVHFGPCSINLLLSNIAHGGRNTGSLTGRISELRAMGLIEAAGFESAPSTGCRVTLWKATGRLPVKVAKVETKGEKIVRLEKRIAFLENRIRVLEMPKPLTQGSLF